MPPASGSASRAKSRASGKQATRFHLDDAQLDYLDSFLPSFEAQIFEHDPHHEGHTKPVSDWTNRTAKEIMNSPLFVSLPSTSGETLPAWIKTIKRRFSNHFSNNMAPKFFKKFHSDHKHCSSTTGSATSTSNSALQDALRSATYIFQGDTVDARELFTSQPETKLLLADKMKEISTQFPHLVGGALRNKALAILWDSLGDEDRELWKISAKSVLHDISLNRTHFSLLIGHYLQQLCGRGILGTVFTSFSYAFRDESGSVNGGTTYAGFDSATQEALCRPPPGCDSRESGWLDMANSVLPRHELDPSKITFSLNEEGTPLFPEIELAKSAPERVVSTLNDYLTAVWVATSYDGSTKSVPWEDLASRPNDFYDTSLFVMPVKLENPMIYLNNPVNMYKLVEFFRDCATPFQFRSIALAQPGPAPATINPTTPSKASITSTPPAPALPQHPPFDSNPVTLPNAQPIITNPPSSTPISLSSPNPIPVRNRIPVSLQTQPNDTTQTQSTKSGPDPAARLGATHTQPIKDASISSPEVNTDQQPLSSGPKTSKKRGRGRPVKNLRALESEISESVTPVAPALPAPVSHSRTSTRNLKRKADSESASSVSGPVKKKKRPGFFYEDGKGGFIDGNGNPVDSNGDPIGA